MTVDKIISFAWTSEPLVMLRKTVTRRPWHSGYARQFHAGDIVQAYNRQPKHKGFALALIELTADPIRQSSTLMPDGDYEGEGFAYFDELIAAGRRDVSERLRKSGHIERGQTLRDRFDAYRRFDTMDWVIRFRFVDFTAAGETIAGQYRELHESFLRQVADEEAARVERERTEERQVGLW